MDFSNKTSLFDLVSMIIPGYTLIFSLSKILNIGELDSSGVAIVPILAASYIVGMLIHHLSKLIFDRIFRDDTELMEETGREVLGREWEGYKRLKKLKEELEDRQSKRDEAEEKGKLKQAEKELKQAKEKYRKKIKALYYNRYYKAISRYKNTSIHILEAQFSFVRSMIIVLPFLLIDATLETSETTLIITTITLAIIAVITKITLAIIAVITKITLAIIKKSAKGKPQKASTVVIITSIVAIITSIVAIITKTACIKKYVNEILPCCICFWTCFIITQVLINIILASWILPAINRQIYKSVWEDELYTRDLDK